MANNPATTALVSFIMPVYNIRVDWVQKAIDSVLEWSVPLEIIVVDDGSTDHALIDYLVNTSATEPRIRYTRQENSGVPAARNVGLSLAQGLWITYFDGDDLFLPTKQLTEALSKNSTDEMLIFGAVGLRTADGQETELYSVKALEGASPKDLASSMMSIYRYGRVSPSFLMGVPWAKFFRASWLRENKLMRCNERVLKRSDAEWLLRVFAAKPQTRIINSEVVAYRFDAPGSNSKSYRDGILEGYLILRDSAASIPEVEAEVQELYWTELIKDAINSVFSNPLVPAPIRSAAAYRAFRNQFNLEKPLIMSGALSGASAPRKSLYVAIRYRWFLPIVALRLYKKLRLLIK